MRRLALAPNLAIATLWCDWLRESGFEASVQRAYASGIAGEIPPDQALPEVWLLDDERFDAALAQLEALRRQPQRRWFCRGCGECIEGGFEQCWKCGGMMPA